MALLYVSFILSVIICMKIPYRQSDNEKYSYLEKSISGKSDILTIIEQIKSFLVCCATTFIHESQVNTNSIWLLNKC